MTGSGGNGTACDSSLKSLPVSVVHPQTLGIACQLLPFPPTVGHFLRSYRSHLTSVPSARTGTMNGAKSDRRDEEEVSNDRREPDEPTLDSHPTSPPSPLVGFRSVFASLLPSLRRRWSERGTRSRDE